MLKVLVIDDEAPIRHWLEFCVDKTDGFEISGVASNGTEGLKCFKESLPDIVVTDIEMPNMDGLEMLGKMQLMHSNFYAIILTSHDDFSYARKALRLGMTEYILKTEISDSSFSDGLKKAALYIHEKKSLKSKIIDNTNQAHFLESIAMKKKKFPKTIEEFRKYGVELTENNLVAMVINNKSSYMDRKELFQKFNGFRYLVSFSAGYNRTMALANVISGEEKTFIRSIIEQHGTVLINSDCYLGISDLVNSFSEAESIMQTADVRCNQSFYQPEQHVVFEGAMKVEELVHREAYSASFIKNLVKQDYRKAIQIKNEVVDAVREQQPGNIESVKNLFLSFMSSILYFTQEDISAIEKRVEIGTKLVQDSECLDALIKIINDVFLEVESNIQSNSTSTDEVKRAIQYIEDHYSEKISLSSVAGIVSFSPEYFSRLFVKETGVNFVVYLNNIRMKNAVTMLENTNLKVYEIAEKAGYSSLSYFSTTFKKKFGLNPYEYQLKSKIV